MTYCMPFMTLPMHTFVSSPCSATKGYSSSDMTALAKDAALGPIRGQLERCLHVYTLVANGVNLWWLLNVISSYANSGMDFESVKSLKPSQVSRVCLAILMMLFRSENNEDIG